MGNTTLPSQLTNFASNLDIINAVNSLLSFAKGDLLPIDAVTGNPVTNSINLGSLQYIYNAIFVNQLNANGGAVNLDVLQRLSDIVNQEGSPFISNGRIIWRTFGGGRNLIINGDFKINQRNKTSPIAVPSVLTTRNDAYGFDKWFADAGTSYSFVAKTSGSVNGGNIISLVNGQSIYQTIENIYNDFGGVYSISVVAGGISGVSMAYAFGSGLTSDGKANGNFISISNLGQTVSIPAGNYITIKITGGLQGGTVTDVQFELGNGATNFEPTRYDIELLKCLRYFEKRGGTTTDYRLRTPNQTFEYLVIKRVAPSVYGLASVPSLIQNDKLQDSPDEITILANQDLLIFADF